jgi:hypothetical protein
MAVIPKPTKVPNGPLVKPNGEALKGGGWIQKATKNMRKDKPCTGSKFGSKTCPAGSRRYALAKTFKAMRRARKGK